MKVHPQYPGLVTDGRKLLYENGSAAPAQLHLIVRCNAECHQAALQKARFQILVTPVSQVLRYAKQLTINIHERSLSSLPQPRS